jgi:Ca2+-binding RTX toxin-like protein
LERKEKMVVRMNLFAQDNDDPYLWYVFGRASAIYPWGSIFGGGGVFANQWITISQAPRTAPGEIAQINLTSQTPYTDPRDADRVTFNISGNHSVQTKDVEYIDGVLDKTTSLFLYNHHGFTTDGSIDKIRANIGNQEVFYTTAVKDSSLFLGAGWDQVRLVDQLDIPGTQYWSVIRRDGNQIDAYSLLTGNRVRLEEGAESRNADQWGNRNYGEVEDLFLADARNGGTVKFAPGKTGDIPNGSDIGVQTNIDLRSDGQAFSDSFNLAYFNFIRYTSDNVWVGEATIHDGTASTSDTSLNYSTPSDRRVAADKNGLLKSGYNYDAPILEGQLSVIGQSRNGTHDLIVAERDPGEAINGHFRLYAFDVDSDLYNEFNQVFLGTAAGENPVNFASATVDTPANRVAMYGFGGNDILTSGAGKDYLFGGRSTFNVTNANNTAIVSNSGNVITGGTGADYFGTGATNSLGQLIDGAGAVLGTGLETGAPQGSFIGSTSTGGTDGKGVGLFWVSHATDVITDWEAGIDTLVVLENGVAIIGGVRSGATVTDLRGSNTSGADGNTTINLRATAAVATSDQDFDGARGGDDWDSSEDLDYIFANQDDRDDNSITNEANDVTVVNAGLIVARGLGGTDTLLDSPGNDYLYGNRGYNSISLTAGGNDRVYYDTFDGAQARHYVSDFTKSNGVATDRDAFYLNKGVIDAFYSAGSTRALTTANVNGVYNDAIAYSTSINFLHDTFYNPSIVTTNAVHRGEDGTAPSVLSGSDGTTFGIGVGMFAAGTALLFVPFMAGVGYALMASGTALGAGSSLVNTQPHQNATFAGNVGAYLNVLTESPDSNGDGTLIKPTTSVGSADSGVTFLSFFGGVNAGDGYLPLVEFTSHAGQGIYGYFALHSSTETFVYVVASRDNLVTASEAIQIAQIEGNLTAADFAIYDGRVDIYNQAVEDPIVIVEPTIVTLGDDTIVDVLTLDPKRFDDVDNPLNLTMTVPGNVVGANIKIYDGTSIVYNGTTGTYTSVASGNNPGGDLTMTSSTYDADTGLTTFVFSDERVLGTRAIQTDENELNDAVNGNQFQLADTVVNYTVAFADPTTGIETYDGTGGVEVAGGNATIDGQAGDDILFVSETSSFLNNAHDNQLVSIESIAVTGSANIDLSNQSEGFSISGSGAADTIVGGAGANYIVGGGGNDSLVGASNNDTFVGFTGIDTISAGSGTDKLVISGTSSDLNSASNAQITGIDIVEVDIAEVSPILGLIVEGGVVTGVDVVNPGAGLVDGTYNISLQPASGFGTAAVVAVTVSNGSIVIPTVAGTDKPALLTPTSGGSAYNSPASDVAISTIAFSGDGALVDLSNQSDGFQIVGDSYADTLIGSSGNDTLTGGAGADEIDGGDGNDTLRFASGDELAADTSVTGGNGSDTIEITAADLTIVDADFTNVLTLEALSLTGASSAILGTEATQGGITTVRTGTGATSITRTDTTATSVDASNMGNDTSLTIDDTGVTTNFAVLNLTGDLTASSLAGTLNVGLSNNSSDGDISLTLGTGSTTVSGGHSSDTVTINTQAVDQYIDISGSDANHIVNMTNGAQTLIAGTGVDTITTGAGTDDGLTLDRIEFHTGTATANINLSGDDASVISQITTITDYNEDEIDFTGTDAVWSNQSATGFSTNTYGFANFDAGITTLAGKIQAVHTALDATGSGDSQVVAFIHGDDTFAYSSGVGNTANDDQIVRIAGETALTNIVTGNSFVLRVAPVSGTPASSQSLLPNTTTWSTGNTNFTPTSFDPGGTPDTNLLLNNLGGSTGFGTQYTSGDDRNQAANVTFDWGSGNTSLNMFGTEYSTLYMGTNGYVTFGTGYSGYVPSGIAGFTRSPMIAGQFDDLYVGSGARNVTSGSGGGNSTGSSNMFYYGDANKMVFTWDNVGLYSNGVSNSQHSGGADYGSAFQIILWKGTSAGDFGIEIRYEDVSLQYATATAGWTAGDTINYQLINPGSSNLHTAAFGSNVGQNGLWAWEVSGGTVSAPYYVPDVDITTPVQVARVTFPGVTSTQPTIAGTDGSNGFVVGSPTDQMGGQYAILSTTANARWNLWKDRYVDGIASIRLSAGGVSTDIDVQINNTGHDPVTRTGNTLQVSATSAELNAATNSDIATVSVITAQSAASSVNMNLSSQTHALTIIGSDAKDTIYGGSSSDTFVVNSAGGDQTVGGEILDGNGAIDTLIVSGGTNAVVFSDDTISEIEVLDMTVTSSGAADSDDQTVTMMASQVSAFEAINADGGDKIILSTAMSATMLDNTVLNGTLSLQTANVVNSLKLSDSTMSAGDVLKVIASAQDASASLNFDGSLEAEGTASVIGGAGSDVMTGTQGRDTFSGGGGNDTIDGGVGNDTLTGGAGDDRFEVGSGTDVVNDLETGDVLVVTAGATANATVAGNFVATSATGNTAGTVNISGTNGAAHTIDLSNVTGTTGYTIRGGDGNDRIVGSDFADLMDGLSGGDTLIAGHVGDSIYGGFNDDVLMSKDSVDVLTGILDGGAGTSDKLVLDDQDNISGAAVTLIEVLELDADASVTMTLGQHEAFSTITAGGTADQITLSTAGIFTGEAAIEKYNVTATSVMTLGALTQNAEEIGAEGNSTLVFGAGAYSGTFTNFEPTDVLKIVDGTDISGVTGLDAGVLDFQNATATITLSAAQNGSLTILNAGTGSQTIIVDGADTFTAFAGIESYELAAGANSVTTGATNQAINADALNDGELLTLAGSHDVSVSLTAGDLTSTSTGNLIVTATSGTNVIITGAGDDVITGGAGVDAMDGGAGADVFVISATADHPSNETITGGSETDVIRFASTAGATLTLSASVLVEEVRIAAADGTATGTTSENIDATNALGGIKLYGNAGDNQLKGNEEANDIYGGAGNDTIYGYGGSDDLLGQTGDDSLEGGAGFDNLNGGGGNDTLTGGGDVDVFFIDADGSYTDVITDLGAGGNDDVRFTATGGSVAATLAADYTASGNTYNRSGDEANFVIYTNGYDVDLSGASAAKSDDGFTVLESGGVDTSIVGSQHNDSLMGGVGNDTITGGAGNDRLGGGGGADVFTYSSNSAGLDTFTDFSTGIDTYETTFITSNNTSSELSLSASNVVTFNGDVGFNFNAGSYELLKYSFNFSTDRDSGATLFETVEDPLSAFDLLQALEGQLALDAGGAIDVATNGAFSSVTPYSSFLLQITNSENGNSYLLEAANNDDAVLGITEVTLVGIFENATLTAADIVSEDPLYFYSLPVVSSGVADVNDFDSSVSSGFTSGDDTVSSTDPAFPSPIRAGAGNDSISMGGGSQEIYAGSGDDTISAGAGSDTLYGGSGDDVLYGGAHANVFIGGFGADTIEFEEMATQGETAIFNFKTDTGDTLFGFTPGSNDKLDFSNMDADDNTGGVQSFTVSNSNSLSANSISWFYDSDAGRIQLAADTNGDTSTAEFVIWIDDQYTTTLASSDFIL